MKKQQIQLIVMLVILAAMCAALFGAKQYNKKLAEEPEETDEVAINEVNSDDIVRFSYDYEGVTYTYEKEEDTWYYADDHELPLLQNSTLSVIQGVTPLMVTQVIEDVTDMSQYGLSEPQRTISYETATESYILYVGDENAVTSSYYVSFPSESTVYVVKSSHINRFDKTVNDLVDSSALETEESAEESTEETVEESVEKNTEETAEESVTTTSAE